MPAEAGVAWGGGRPWAAPSGLLGPSYLGAAPSSVSPPRPRGARSRTWTAAGARPELRPFLGAGGPAWPGSYRPWPWTRPSGPGPGCPARWQSPAGTGRTSCLGSGGPRGPRGLGGRRGRSSRSHGRRVSSDPSGSLRDAGPSDGSARVGVVCGGTAQHLPVAKEPPPAPPRSHGDRQPPLSLAEETVLAEPSRRGAGRSRLRAASGRFCSGWPRPPLPRWRPAAPPPLSAPPERRLPSGFPPVLPKMAAALPAASARATSNMASWPRRARGAACGRM